MEGRSAKEAKALSKQIDKQLRKEKQKREKEIRLLLLGAGESGKSTIAKQMKILHLSGFTADERRAWREVVHTNVLASTCALINGARKLKIKIQNQDAAQNIISYCSGTSEDTTDNFLTLTPQLAEDIKLLWADSGIQAAYARSSEFQLDDSAGYFITHVDRLADRNYQPTDEDMLRARLRTTSVTETEWSIDGMDFRMIDVGGQRGERSKWIHHFSDVTAIIFCAAISEYDQVIREDGCTNRVQEALNLFRSICTSNFLQGIPIILFLNKKDLFEEKIKHVDLKVCFRDYTGRADFTEASEFVKKKFLDIAKEAGTRVFPSITCATDTDNVLLVWDAVKDIIMREILGAIGVGGLGV